MAASSNKKSDSRSLLTIVLDVSPSVWGERQMRRSANDKARSAANKKSAGPATLDEVLRSVQGFCSSFGSLERGAGLLIVAVADNETAVVFPRKDHLAKYFASPETNPCYDLRTIQTDLLEGVAELTTLAASKRNTAVSSNNNAATTSTQTDGTEKASSLSSSSGVPAAAAAARTKIPPGSSAAAMASAFSLALCIINRFLVATHTGVGVSAIRSEYFARPDDGGVLAMIGGGDDSHKKKKKKANAWSPRILLVQACNDRSRDYNAFMNSAFAAVKHNIVLDGCFIPSGAGKNATTSSAFLEQACDLTGGVFLAPSGLAQVGGALTEVLMSVFLAPRFIRGNLNLPTINKVDFRARCFESGDIVDMAYVCNQCLSIFKKKPKDECPTCQADIKISNHSTKKAKIND